MPRDQDVRSIATKWASSGDVATPESEGIAQAIGFGPTYSQASGDLPPREVVNWVYGIITGLATELNQHGLLEWDATISYAHPALVILPNGNIYLSKQDSLNQDPATDTSETFWERLELQGWSPIIAVIADGDRFVLELEDWTGGTGSKPAGAGNYIGTGGLVAAIADGTNIRGLRGLPGIGTPGDNGYSPTWSIQNDGARRVIRIESWVGGTGTPPSGAGQYVGASGFVTDINDAIDIRGPAGSFSGGSISSSDIQDGAITEPKLADGAVTRDKIANDAVDTAQLADDAVTDDQLANNAVGSEHIQSGAVGASEIASSGVGSSEIASNAVGSSELADDAVGTNHIEDDAVTRDKIANDAVDTAQLADDAVEQDQLASNSVGSSQIRSSAVGNSEIASNAVGSSEIANDAVGTSELADGAVDTDRLANNAVTEAKLGDGAVARAKLGSDTGAVVHVSDNAPTSSDGQDDDVWIEY